MNIYLSYTAINNLILTLRASHEQLDVKNSKYLSPVIWLATHTTLHTMSLATIVAVCLTT